MSKFRHNLKGVCCCLAFLLGLKKAFDISKAQLCYASFMESLGLCNKCQNASFYMEIYHNNFQLTQNYYKQCCVLYIAGMYNVRDEEWK